MTNKQKIKIKLSKKIAIGYALGFIISLVLFLIFLNFGSHIKGSTEGIYFDKKIMEYISENMNMKIKPMMIFLSFLGSAKFYIPIYLLIIFSFMKKRKYLYSIVLLNGVLGTAILNYLVKKYYCRVRPEMYFKIKETGFSFPSGHSMVAASSYLILIYILFRREKWDFKKIISWTITVVLVLSIGFSRIYLGVHWPTDVIAGFNLGLIWMYVNMIIVETVSKDYRKDIKKIERKK